VGHVKYEFFENVLYGPHFFFEEGAQLYLGAAFPHGFDVFQHDLLYL
jgi:hypothetical protein